MSIADFEIRRILFAVDVSTLNDRVITRVVELARELRARLDVVFVEDESLLQMADEPLIGHVSIPGGTQTRLERHRLERDFRIAGERTRVVLETVTRRTNVNWHFRVSRSLVPNEAASSGSECDLVVIGSVNNPLGGALQRTPMFAQVAKSCNRPTLLLRPNPLYPAPAIALHHPDADIERTIAATAKFVSPGQTVILMEPMDDPVDEESYQRLRHELSARRIGMQRRVIESDALESVGRVARTVEAGIVVLPCRPYSQEDLDAAASSVASQVLVVR